MNALFDDMYMKKHLGDYVLFQLGQGYALADIKNALHRFGYKKSLVKEILDRLHITEPRKKSAMYSGHDLDQELKVYVQSLLIDYIVKEHKVGYPLEAIKKALINFGHDSFVIDEAIVIIEKGQVVDYRLDANPVAFPQQIVAPLTVFLIFGFLVFLSIATDTSIITIIPNFLPLFFSFIIANVAYYFMPKTPFLASIPLFAVLLAGGAFLGGIQYGILGRAPGSDIILILNATVAFISTGIVCAFSKKGKDEIVVHIKDKAGKPDKAQREQAEKERTLVEDKIHIPKIGAEMPKEPYYPKGHPVIPHSPSHAGAQQIHHAPSAQHLQHGEQKNSMLAYLKQGIDNPKSQHRVIAQKHPPVSRSPVLVSNIVSSKAKSPNVRLMPSSLETLPDKKEKEKKISLKEF